MTISKDFGDLYKTYSNTALLDILDNPENYQPLAVEAARTEFALRNLTEAEIDEARSPLTDRKNQVDKKKEKIQAFENNIRQVGGKFAETFSPVKSDDLIDQRIIRIIVLVFGLFAIYQVFGNLKLHMLMLEEMRRIPSTLLTYYFPLLILPLSVFEFWRRKKTGWILLTIFLTFSSTNAIIIFVDLLKHTYSGDSANSLFVRPSPVNFSILLLFYIGSLCIICKRSIMEIFLVDKKAMVLAIGITGILSLILMLMIL